MVFGFLIIWALGAALLLACCALIWSERLTVLRTVPLCAKCGYDVVGLPRAARCPECGAFERKLAIGPQQRPASHALLVLWVVPTICGLAISLPLTLMAQVTSPDNVLGIAANTIVFIACGAMVRFMLGWITLAAAKTIMWCCMASLSLPLIAVVLDAMYGHNIESKPAQVLLLGPLLIAPFAGFGVGAGILLHARNQSQLVILYEDPAKASA